MGKKRLFSTAPITAMLDRELTGQEWRVLLWVSLHDGMSLLKGNGAGCYASNLTLFAEVGCDYASGCRALSKLVKRGHLVREQLGRSTRYRVIFGDPDNLQACNISPAQQVAGSQGEVPGYVAEPHEEVPENASETPLDYSPLSGELDSGKPEELNSIEMAHRSFDAREVFDEVFASATPKEGKRHSAEAGLSREWSLAARLPKNFKRLPVGAQVAKIEEAFNELGRDADRLDERERATFSNFLWETYEAQFDENAAISAQAMRLSEQLAIY